VLRFRPEDQKGVELLRTVPVCVPGSRSCDVVPRFLLGYRLRREDEGFNMIEQKRESVRQPGTHLRDRGRT
jgi:hypothetical protein